MTLGVFPALAFAADFPQNQVQKNSESTLIIITQKNEHSDKLCSGNYHKNIKRPLYSLSQLYMSLAI